jgi:hypothetical protein
MKILKTIGMIYLGILAIAGIGIFVLFPVALAYYLKNENYYLIFLVNLPIFFGVMFQYMNVESGRPKRR